MLIIKNKKFKSVAGSLSMLYRVETIQFSKKKYSPLLNTTISRLRLNKLKLRKHPQLKYTLSFKSLFPFSLPPTIFSVHGVGSKFIDNSGLTKRKTGFSRVLVKNSYILFTWFFYLNTVVNRLGKFNRELVPSFFIKPKNTSKLTILKAPMAHKTFSQEQYRFRFYGFFFIFSFKNYNAPPSANSALFAANYLRNSFFFFETNFFILNRIKFFFQSTGIQFLKINPSQSI